MENNISPVVLKLNLIYHMLEGLFIFETRSCYVSLTGLDFAM